MTSKTINQKILISFFVLLQSIFCLSGKLVLNINEKECSHVALTGGKASTLCQIKSNLHINVSDGFCITTEMYDKYLKSIGVDTLIEKLEGYDNNNDQIHKISQKIRSKIKHGKLEKHWISKIKSQYDALHSNNTDLLVAVRSSSTAEDMPDHSFAGQYKSYLNVSGVNQLIENIKKVWASTYSSKVIHYRNRNNIKHSQTKMGVLIQKMIPAFSSGRGYSVDIETGHPFVSIKSILGLGEAEASGIATPDTWVLDTHGNMIKQHLGKKQFRIEYDFEKRENSIIENFEELKNKYALTFDQAKKLAKTISLLHEYFLLADIKHIEVEYAVTDKGTIFLTQARPETSWGKIGTVSLRAVDKKKVGKSNPLILEGGKMGWGGVVVGTLRVLRSLEEAKRKHQNGDIIAVGNTTNIWENIMVNSGGLISEEDASSSHAVATTREECIPSVVGIADALTILEKYDGQVVTLDATSRRLYLGTISENSFYFPKKIETVFGGVDTITLEQHWNEASLLGLTSIDIDGNKWLRRPVGGTRAFQHKIAKIALDWIAVKLNLPLQKRVKIKDKTLEIDFSSIFEWREILRERDIDFFENIYYERLKANDAYIEASLHLDYTPESVQKWIDANVAFLGFQHTSFNVGKITDGLLHEALAKRNLPEPYLSLVRPAMEALYGKSLSKERVCWFNSLLKKLQLNPQLFSTIKNVAEETPNAAHSLKNDFPDFYKDLEQYAKNYRVAESFSIDLVQPWFLNLVAKQLVKEFDCDKAKHIKTNHVPIKDIFFPDDKEFQRIAQLAILTHKLKLDTHHIRCRGHWRFKEFITPFGDFLKRKGIINNLSEVFDREPQWLLAQLDTYRNDDELKQLCAQRDKGFQILPYKSYTIGDMSWENDLEENFPRGGKRICSFCNSNLECVLYKRNNFYVQLNDSPITEGALLINPTEHIYSCAVLNKEKIEELEKLHIQIRKAFETAYGSENQKLIFVEHGSTSLDEAKVCIGGGSVVHAHLHGIPVPKNFDLMMHLKQVLNEKFYDSNFKIIEIQSMSQLTDRRIVPNEASYLFIENTDGKMWVVIIKGKFELPSMFVLRLIAEKVGSLDGGNWKVLSDEIRKDWYIKLSNAKKKLVPICDNLFENKEAGKRSQELVVMDDVRKDVVDIIYLSTSFRLLKIKTLLDSFASNIKKVAKQIENGVEKMEQIVCDNSCDLNSKFVKKSDYVRNLFIKIVELYEQAKKANTEKNEALLLEKLAHLLAADKAILHVFNECKGQILHNYTEDNTSFLLAPIFS